MIYTDDVFQVADALHFVGHPVSVRVVRSELGDRGSHSTISRHLRKWREQRGVTRKCNMDLLTGTQHIEKTGDISRSDKPQGFLIAFEQHVLAIRKLLIDLHSNNSQCECRNDVLGWCNDELQSLMMACNDYN